MPSEIMDQRRFCMMSAPISFFSEEIRFPVERQIGFWKPESMPDHRGTEGISLMLGSKSVSSSSFGRLHPIGAQSAEQLEPSQSNSFENYKTKFSHEQHSLGNENSAGLSMTSWRAAEQDLGTLSDQRVQPATLFLEGNKVNTNSIHGLFSSALSDIFDKKLRLSSNVVPFSQPIDVVSCTLAEGEPVESLEEIEAQTIGNLLPDDDELLSGLIDDLECTARPSSGDEVDDDLFYSGGGLELGADDNLNCNKASDFLSEISSNCQQGGSYSLFAGEHPCCEHPSRTLFVRNINSNVEDAELKVLFEKYGDIRTLYTACKHRGFVMISYYDIRAARNAMRALQNKPLRRRKLDIHFSIPKDNPPEKDINQGTLVVSDLDSSVSNDDLHQIFGVYGEIKEIHEPPRKGHYKFIEYYDIRAAEAALRTLSGSDIAGKKIKLLPCRPRGARCIMQPLSLELEQEESADCWQGSPPSNLPLTFYGSIPLGGVVSNGLDAGASQGLHPAARTPVSPFMETAFDGISSSVPNSLSSPIRVASVSNHNNHSGHCEPGHSLGDLNLGFQCMLPFHPHSLPEFHDGMMNSVTNSMSSMGFNMNSRPTEGIDPRFVHRVGSGVVNGHSFQEGVLGVMGNGSCTLQEHQYVLNGSNSYNHHPHGPVMWSSSPSFVNSIPVHASPQMHGLARSSSHMLNTVLPLHHHHVGSAPAVNPSLWDRRHVYVADSAEATGFHPGSLGSIGFPGSSQLHPLELVSHNIFPHAGGNCIDPSLSSAHAGIPSPQQRSSVFHGRNSMIPMPASFDVSSDRIRSRRSDVSANQVDNKKQYELDIDRILRGEDSRTTLMIKNIPNKYTSKMLLATIDEHHRGTYDFIYLPIDFKNKCNVGYAFINMIDPQQIIPFYQACNGKKWEKFNSEKVASLAYARIQGKAALVAHFQNSSLMNEDKRCRPILFHTDGPNAGDQEPFPVGPNIRSRPGKLRTASNEDHLHDCPPSSANGEESFKGTDSSSSSTKDS